MHNVVGIRFKSCGKIYDFEVNGIDVSRGDRVIVESEFGLSIGYVVVDPHHIENPTKDLKKVIRIADEGDIKQKQENENLEREARTFCFERIMARGLPMKLISSEVALDRKRIIFYFTAEGRIDFRELVKDLAAKFKTRIEMRQIGVRDKAKLVGGLGLCGKELCCRLFLTSFEPISIKMAKQQELVLNTGKLSGICGRLMCCLGYEYNEGVPVTPPAPEETVVSLAEEGEEELQEVSEKEVESTPAGICCPAAAKPETPPGRSGEKKEQEKPERFKKRKKRRRYRKRFHKDE
jgi:cell fate regulator YaaT (PSP1 superfamily)